MNEFRPVILVPHYNHVRQFSAFLPDLLATGTPLLVVDDGSETTQREPLEALAGEHGFDLLRRPENRGKGDAIMAGFEYAARLCYTHALQVDADGQHDPADVGNFLECARARPGTLVCGAPVFGEDAPRSRVWGRKLTDLMVFLETWSTGIRDSLCGFRVYPLAATMALIERHRPGSRMQFDAEILVMAYWNGTPLHFLDTRVTYPEHGESHFDLLRDNLRMVLTHTRLMLRMLLRSPVLLANRFTRRAGMVTKG